MLSALGNELVTQAVDAVRWDAIVIGTGLGGAHAGDRLVDAGMKVLFVDRGAAPVNGQPTPLEQLEAEVSLNGRSVRRVQTTVAAVGGTSVIYAASLEQPERHDLDEVPGIGPARKKALASAMAWPGSNAASSGSATSRQTNLPTFPTAP